MTSSWARVLAIQPDKNCSGWGCTGCNKCVDVLDEVGGEGRFPERGNARDDDQETRGCAGNAGTGRFDKNMFVIRLILTR